MKFSQTGIKQENIRAVFSAVSSSVNISRADIAQKTGVSLMTVGKIADTLLDAGIVRQSKPATGASGRRAGFLTLSENHIILVGNITLSVFRACVKDLRLETTDSFSMPYNDSLSLSDNLDCFFRDMSTLLLKHLPGKKLIGSGLALPGEYDRQNDTFVRHRGLFDDSVQIRHTMMRATGFAPDVIENSIYLSAHAWNFEKCSPEGCTLTLSLDGTLDGCLSFDGRPIASGGEKSPDFSHLTVKSDLNGAIKTEGAAIYIPFDRFLAENPNEAKLAAGLGEALTPIAAVLRPDAIFVESTTRRLSAIFAEDVEKVLKRTGVNTEVFVETTVGTHCENGLAGLLRDKWISSSLEM